jgi:hypothetical protein
MKSLLLSLIFLVGCSVKSPEAVSVTIPTRKPIKPVEVTSCYRDSVCPPGGAVVMDQDNFGALQENIINTEIYLQQLQELLKSLLPKKD